MNTGHPILQFGTGRFLQAHVDLFVSQALAVGDALGGITVVQTTTHRASTARTSAMAAGDGFEVRIRGLVNGAPVESRHRCTAVRAALHADAHWATIRDEVATGAVQVIVSNTGDDGWRLDADDTAALLDQPGTSPRSFPAKLLVLLHARWTTRPDAALTLLPCELVSRNGDVLQGLVVELAEAWGTEGAFRDYLHEKVCWANSLVDRIVSEALQPVGAVAEPYALWAIERQARLVLPCRHPSIVLTDDLGEHERLKLHLLNLGHTVLAELWRRAEPGSARTVVEAMNDPHYRDALEAVWQDEVLPVFAIWGLGEQAQAYLPRLRDRLLNPYLAHRIADIAQNHVQKKQRRLAPVVEAAQAAASLVRQPWLRAALASA